MSPVVKPLSYWQRRLVFGSLLLAFIISLPAFIFYATGYRYDLNNPDTPFTATGGFYVVSDNPEGTIFLDEKPVQNIRSFRSAAYIQGIEPGLHRLHVQAPGLQTWVKELPVMAHMVTEAEAFNLPVTPRVRLIPEYTTKDGLPVIFSKSTTTPVLSYLATTTTLYIAKGTATSTYDQNQEYSLLSALFTEQASTTKAREAYEKRKAEHFGFSNPTINGTSTEEKEFATTTLERDTIILYEANGEVYAFPKQDNFRQIPHYFCAPQVAEKDILPDETPDVEADQVTSNEATTSTEKTTCRDRIKIDRQGQTVISFAFFPNNTNLVLMHLTDGIYVVEIDDRAWQNVQPLYLGKNLELLLYRDGIFIKEKSLIFEVSTDLES